MTWIYKVINATHNKQNTKIVDNFVPQITYLATRKNKQ